MDKNLTQQQVKSILDNAPKGANQEKIVQGLVDRGYILQGLNDQKPEELPKESSATFKATGDENLVTGTLKAVGNVPSSAINLGKNVVQAVANPADTVTSLGSIAVGGASKLGRVMGTGANVGKPVTQEEESFDGVINFFKERYGSVDALKRTLIEDPAGAAADIASIFSGAGAATRTASLSKVGRVVEPVNAINSTLDVVKNSTVGKIASDVLPTSDKVIQGQVVKALELTPGDLATIQKKTGNDPARYVIDNNLLKQTPEETAIALENVRKVKKQEVRDAVSQVSAAYDESAPAVINLRKGLSAVLDGLKYSPDMHSPKVPVAGMESVVSEIETLIKKPQYNLIDMQIGKELLDQNSNIYSKLGDVKSSSVARGLDNIRGDLKTFIEDEVALNTSGKVDIRGLNNDVATTYSLQEAITNRALRGQSRQYLTVFDGILGTGAYAAGGPLAAAGLVIGKKIVESPTFRLFVAKSLTKVSPSTLAKMAKEIEKGTLSPSAQKILQRIIEEAKKNLPYLESGANALDQVQTETE